MDSTERSLSLAGSSISFPTTTMSIKSEIGDAASSATIRRMVSGARSPSTVSTPAVSRSTRTTSAPRCPTATTAGHGAGVSPARPVRIA